MTFYFYQEMELVLILVISSVAWNDVVVNLKS